MNRGPSREHLLRATASPHDRTEALTIRAHGRGVQAINSDLASGNGSGSCSSGRAPTDLDAERKRLQGALSSCRRLAVHAKESREVLLREALEVELELAGVEERILWREQTA